MQALQPCAGLVSLVLVQQPVTGPPHMHPLPPARAHFLGDTSPQVWLWFVVKGNLRIDIHRPCPSFNSTTSRSMLGALIAKH